MVSVCLPSDALLQHLPCYLGFSYLGRGVSLHGCSSKAQPLLLTLDKGYLLNSMKKQNDRILKEKLPRSVGAQYATGDQWRNNSRKNEGMEPKKNQYPVVDVAGDRSKVWCCKEQYWIGTWNIRSMNQGKLEVFKQEMARVNVDILWISELKWTGMGEFNSGDHYISTTVGKIL